MARGTVHSSMDKINRINSLVEAVRSSPRRVHKILIQKDSDKKKIAEIVHWAKVSHIPYLFVPKNKLDTLDRNHQGVIGFVSPKAFVPLDRILNSAETPFLLLCDGVEDPQNLGAIIRAAEGAGVDGLILPERRAAGITDAVLSVSAGAAEHLAISRVINMARTMDDLRERGIWLIGTEAGGQDYWFEFDFTVPLGVVVGSEGKGLRPLVRSKCDKILSIPLSGKMTSLNVAAAAAIFLFEVVRQRKKCSTSK